MMEKTPNPPLKPEGRTSHQFKIIDGVLFVSAIISGGFLIWLI